MDIDIGMDLHLMSDKYQFWLERDEVIQKGKNKGKPKRKRVSGYFPYPGDCAANYLSDYIREGEYDSIAKAMSDLAIMSDALKKHAEMVRELWNKNYGRNP